MSHETNPALGHPHKKWLGPDSQNDYQLTRTTTWLTCSSNGGPLSYSIHFFASELRLRGNTPVEQPHFKHGNVLCWNGEIFEGIDISIEENDGIRFMDALCSLEDPDSIPQLLGSIEGPYAFVFYHEASHKLYFARDPLGRRSLLIQKPSTTRPFFLLTSVSTGADPDITLEELGVEHIYCLEAQALVSNNNKNYVQSLKLLPRHTMNGEMYITPFALPSEINQELPPAEYQESPLFDTPGVSDQHIDALVHHLSRSVQLRVNNIPEVQEKIPRQARLAILFSGGIDSAAMAYFAHLHIPITEPIDLLNVAFENPRKIRTQQAINLGIYIGNTPNSPYCVPDRMSGLEELEELRRVCPERKWNFVEINVPYQETQEARARIESIMYPARTVMDWSLALALYFASRGVGQVRDPLIAKSTLYTSPARVLLHGLGSDELLGGYSRYRTVYAAGGWSAVNKELQLDIDRIPTRNLGRDDRVVSSHGKEVRYPFLSLSVVNFLAGLPVHCKLDPRLELGVGDKMLLRLAMKKVGLVEASLRKKRAMQFGTYSARMEGEKKGDAMLS
ncbi:hypothetical protein AMATHDRAFT_134515 [Amanita thiersii Skay4041]|uniref:Glutamine amidotransferase type-2 domain-containing protein n=1 Tax=Amanita thiersii Skay4041 TaxID=703135 RepID=A0A2A9P0N4_9AGAR|nr:hypothetical protein AMATHDRAFT_134515 [Amanita thiersii Skay4041]